MAKDPAFLFYPGDWQGGTMHMTHLEKGCYMDLLMLQFNRGKFTLAQAKHMLGSSFELAWPNLVEKFIYEDGFYWNERLNQEKEKRAKFTESRRNNGSKEKNKDSNQVKTNKHMDKHMLKRMENENENENINENKKKDRGSGGKGKTLAVQPKPNTLTDNTNLLQTVEMHNGLPPGSAATLAKVFYEIQSSTGNLEGKTIKDYQMHFSNWARKQAQAIKANTTSKAETVQDTFKRWEAQLSQNPEAFYQQALSSYHE
jgi:hypothetical protein